MTETEQTGCWQRTEITPVLAITGQEFPRYLVGIFVAVFQNSHPIEISAVLGYYAACGGNFLPKFRDNLSVSSSRARQSKKTIYLPLKMGPIGCPETSVRNYHYVLRNIT
jgi:hypothetical protein